MLKSILIPSGASSPGPFSLRLRVAGSIGKVIRFVAAAKQGRGEVVEETYYLTVKIRKTSET